MTTEHDTPEGRGPGSTLGQAARAFFTFHSPRSFAVLWPLLVSARIALGGFTWADLAVFPFILAIDPFVEWLIHVYVLHLKPFKLGKWKLDLQIAKFHRAHHRDPWKLDVVFIPRRAGYVGLILLMAGWYSVMPTLPLFTTAVLGSVLMAFVYEWIHYLTHTAYRPRTRLYRHLWRLHRLHHFKNEHYWQGVTTHLADRVLGTLPDHTKVPTSPTCRTLGVE